MSRSRKTKITNPTKSPISVNLKICFQKTIDAPEAYPIPPTINIHNTTAYAFARKKSRNGIPNAPARNIVA